MDLYYPAPKRHFPHWAALNDDPPLEYKPPAPAPAPRITLAGSLDPTTGIFYRTPEHPRLRTAQACEKCRTRKAKVSRLWKKHPLNFDSPARSAPATTPPALAASGEVCSASTPRRAESVVPTRPNPARI
ncbi:hypothetical protein C8R46DRAFT_1087911, partial [Mycena filopes]